MITYPPRLFTVVVTAKAAVVRSSSSDTPEYFTFLLIATCLT